MVNNLILIHNDSKKLENLSSICKKVDNFLVLGTYKDAKSAFQEILDKEIHILLIANSIEDINYNTFIIEIMKVKPLPILIVDETNDNRNNKTARYGIVDFFEPVWDEYNLKNSSRMIIKLNILSKLNIDRFYNQINYINNLDLSDNEFDPFKPQISKNKDETIQEKTDRIRRNTKLNRIGRDKIVSKLSSAISRKSLVVIGSSTGGPRIITYILSKLPEKFPPILVVQHMPRGFVKNYSSRIDKHTNLSVKQAETGDILTPSVVYIAPGDYHLELIKERNKIKILITKSPKVNFVRPSVDVTLKSAVKYYNNSIVTVILTGMGSDGTEGARIVKKAGGKIIALNENDSIMYGMNKSVIEAGYADSVVSMEALPYQIIKALHE